MLASRCLGQPRQSWRSVSIRRTCLGLALAAVGVWKLMIADPAQAASFDCSKASTLVESLICADPTLSALDVEMAAAWGEARRASPNPNQLQESQRAFIRQRGQCQNPRCIADINRQRTAELKAISASAVAPGGGQAAGATPRPTPLTPQQGGGAFAGVVSSQPAAGRGGAGAQQTTRDGKIVQTVVAEGMGSTIESAVQNAAENALKQVVGTFVDTNTQIERRTQISEGLRSETRNIRRDMREYSQGSIQGFEVLDNRMDGAIHRVTAKVAVRVDDFKVYVKKLTEGEAAVGRGLFAQLATEEKNTQSASQLLAKNIFEPLITGEVIRFKIQSPMKAEDVIQKEGLNPALREQFNIAIPVIAYLDEDFMQSMQTLLKSIAADSQTLNLQQFYGPNSDVNGEKCGRWTRSGPSQSTSIPNDISVNLQKLNFVSPDTSKPSNQRLNGTMTAFRLKEVANSPEMSKYLNKRGWYWVLNDTSFPALQVELRGRDGPLLQATVKIRRGLRSGLYSEDRSMFVNKSPSKMFDFSGMANHCESTVIVDMGASESLFIFMKVPLEILASAQSVIVRLVK